MKGLLTGIVLIVLIGIGGFLYRNALENSSQPVACPLDAEVCPDGTSVSRTGISCTFPACPPPNVVLSSINIALAVPSGFAAAALPDSASVAAYASASSTDAASIVIRQYPITASSTALSVIQQTAINLTSGTTSPVTAFSSTVIGNHRFTVVRVEDFEGVVDIAYYLTRSNDVLRFDAVDTNVSQWADPTMDPSTLPGQAALRTLLQTMQGDGM
jgi:hypothetical protein